VQIKIINLIKTSLIYAETMIGNYLTILLLDIKEFDNLISLLQINCSIRIL